MANITLLMIAVCICSFLSLSSSQPTPNSPFRVPQTPTALCFRQPCNPSGFRRRARSMIPGSLEEQANTRLRRGVGDDKGFAEHAKNSNTRGTLHSQRSFGPNSDGSVYSTGKVEHDLWKSRDGNSRLSAFGRYDRVDGGRRDGFSDKKFGLKYSVGF